jgi:hypothetical protein
VMTNISPSDVQSPRQVFRAVRLLFALSRRGGILSETQATRGEGRGHGRPAGFTFPCATGLPDLERQA